MVNENKWSKICFYWYFRLFPETIFIIKDAYALFTMLVKKTVSMLRLKLYNIVKTYLKSVTK